MKAVMKWLTRFIEEDGKNIRFRHVSPIARVTICSCFLEEYPGCSAIRIIRDVRTEDTMRKQGYATETIHAVIDWAKKAGITELQATVNHTAPEMSHIFVKLGFEESQPFVSNKSGNTVRLYKLRLA